MLRFVVNAFAVSFFAGLVAWAFLSRWSGPVPVWAAFVAWACFFYQAGSSGHALRSTIVGSLFGIVCGWAALLIIQAIPWPAAPGMPSWFALVLWDDTDHPFTIYINLSSLWAGGATLVTALVMALLSRVKALAVFPAGVFGYACVFAAGLAEPENETWEALLSISLENSLIAVSIAMVTGALLGLASKKVSDRLLGGPASAGVIG